MRKTYVHLKSYGFYFMLFCCTALFVNSCKKDHTPSTTDSKSALIEEFQTDFENEILSQLKLNDQNTRHQLEKKPLWNKAFVKRISVGDAVIVPILYNAPIAIKADYADKGKSLEKTSYLMIYRDGKKALHIDWVTLIPMLTKNNNKFLGLL